MLKAVEGNKLVSGGGDGLIIVWSLDTYEQIKVIKAHSMPISALKELPEKNVVTSALDCTIKIWCLHTYTCLKVIDKFKNRSSLKKLFSKNSSSGMHTFAILFSLIFKYCLYK
jgi:WD40 repeat protein